MATSRRAALYVRVSTSDRGQTVENQLQPLQEAAGRLGCSLILSEASCRSALRRVNSAKDGQPCPRLQQSGSRKRNYGVGVGVTVTSTCRSLSVLTFSTANKSLPVNLGAGL